MMNDQRHDRASISYAANGAPSAGPRLPPALMKAVALPRSV
jgi:hypothetical protein